MFLFTMETNMREMNVLDRVVYWLYTVVMHVTR